MALNEKDRELLAVVKYYNDNKKGVVRLVNKLANSFDLKSISDVTGFSVNEIGDILDATPKPKARKMKIEMIAPDPVITKVEEPWAGEHRLAIHLNAQSDLAQRLAHDMATYIANEMQSGEKWLSRKEAMGKFECSSVSFTAANGILFNHNWIEPIELGNLRKGYVIK